MGSYVAQCVKCRNRRADAYSKWTKLVPIPTEEPPFNEIVIDCIEALPQSEDFNVILVVTNQFTKGQHHILSKTILTAEEVADAYLNNIWTIYNLWRHRTVDHYAQLASKCLKGHMLTSNTNLRLSTMYYLQTDRLNDLAVVTHKQYLHIYYHIWPKHWQVCLPLTESSYNTTATVANKQPLYSSL